MYLVMGVAWFLLQYLLGTALAVPMPQYLEILSNPYTTLTMTVAIPPAIVVSNPYTTITIMEGVAGTVDPVTTTALSDPPSPAIALPATVTPTPIAASQAAVVPATADPPAVSVTPPPNPTPAVVAPVIPVAVTPPASNTTAIFVAPGPIASSSAVFSLVPTPVQTQSPSNPLNSTVIFSSTGLPVVIPAVSPSNPLNSPVIFSSTGLPVVIPAVSPSNPLNSPVIFSSTGLPVVIPAVSPSNPLNSPVIFSSTGLPVASPAVLPSNPLNSTVIFSSTGLPVASPAASPSNPLNSTVIYSSTGLPSASPAPIVASPPVVTAPSASNSLNPITATNVVSNTAQSQFNVILNSNLAAIPSGIYNQAPVPSITIPLPLISSFPAAANPTANPDGSHQVVPWTVPGTNVTIIATMATPAEAPAISATSYEYTIDSMQYYISGVINTTGGGPLNATQDPFYWDIGYGCWVEFNSNPFLGASGQQLLTYSVIYNALQGMKDALLANGWWYLAFIEIRVGPQGQVVGYATISPSLGAKGSMPITNIDDALQALEQPVGSQSASLVLPGATGATPVAGGAAHKHR